MDNGNETSELGLIEAGIARAEAEIDVLDDATVRRMAAQLHAGQRSAYYALASSGAIEDERLAYEVLTDYHDPKTTEDVKRWLAHLTVYRMENGDRGPVAGWSHLTD